MPNLTALENIELATEVCKKAFNPEDILNDVEKMIETYKEMIKQAKIEGETDKYIDQLRGMRDAYIDMLEWLNK